MSSPPRSASAGPQKLSTRAGHRLAKILRIDLQDDTPYEPLVTRGESVYSLNQAPDAYLEPEPTTLEWFKQYAPTLDGLVRYLLRLFPFVTWIGRYNWVWAYGDLVAGITVGAVVVPQGMAYAKLAQLPPEFGLYSSFFGVLLYWFFATSKDITIGPVAVMSTLVGNIVSDVPADQRPVVASCLALICGCIVLALGLLRLGFIVDYIPLTAIAAFMTGSALNISVGQISNLMGMSGFNTRAATYRVFIDSLRFLGRTKIDAAMGLTALFLLYFLRWVTASYLTRKYPRWQRTWFFLSTLRTAFVILLYTMISWLVNMHRRDNPRFVILGKVPRGFTHVGVPTVNSDTIKEFSSDLPAAVIVLLIEHIAISKSFGRVNNYTIQPSQELIAIGITNIFAPFFGAYPATGSFSRTAIKSKAGVRTPFAGVITAVVVLLAIYCLTAVFFYIPSSSLSAVIIHAVGDLITPPNTVYKFWRVSPVECAIYFIGVLVTVFSSIENGIYVTVACSGGLLLFRIAKARGHFLGKVKVHFLAGDDLIDPDTAAAATAGKRNPDCGSGQPSAAASRTSLDAIGNTAKSPNMVSYGAVDSVNLSSRHVFLPIDHRDGSNPTIEVVNPHPGVFVYRFSEGFLYANASHYTEALVAHVFAETRPGNPNSSIKMGDRPWNDPGPRDPANQAAAEARRPTLKAVVLDFSSVNNVDITSVQNLLDVRNQLDRYATPDAVEWHFASIGNRWTKRALTSAGFGFPNDVGKKGKEGWTPLFSVAEVGVKAAGVGSREDMGYAAAEIEREIEKAKGDDPEAARRLTAAIDKTNSSERKRRVVPVHSIGRPFFHVDLESAVESAVRNAKGMI